MERGGGAIEAQFREWDRQIADLQRRCLAAAPPEAEPLRAALAALAAARERAWSRWELARSGGMWVSRDDSARFEEAMQEARAAFARPA